ncbi:MAG: hypothetical protein D3909_02100 [Candidatus Electrothrix sp. ATG1]|nr:hypothetical protein [Candidatus Electrothrix sp. ATG1]MCI5207841.1 hypothetical protein [Candidatus Electrothrix sp. ATG2]
MMRREKAERKLGLVKEIVEAAGMGISYAYEDLVFLDHNALLLQFTEESEQVLVRINREADRRIVAETVSLLKLEAQEKAMAFIDSGEYALSQGEGENITIEFIP